MASVPNRVYPMAEYLQITTANISTTNLTGSGNISGSYHYGITGSFTSAIRAPFLGFSTTYTLPPSGSMGFGDMAIVTGANGTSVLVYLKVKSGSGNAIYSIACTYVSSGSA